MNYKHWFLMSLRSPQLGIAGNQNIIFPSARKTAARFLQRKKESRTVWTSHTIEESRAHTFTKKYRREFILLGNVSNSHPIPICTYSETTASSSDPFPTFSCSENSLHQVHIHIQKSLRFWKCMSASAISHCIQITLLTQQVLYTVTFWSSN